MSTLPPEIMSDMLCRLPVKSLLRFRCISKDLCSTIDAPDFTKLHLQTQSQSQSHQSLILSSSLLYSIDLHSLERAVEIEHPMKTVQYGADLIGSCNGLMCLFNSDDEIVIWNMSTRKYHRLPYNPFIFSNTHRVSYGFGYDSVHDDYKLVKIARFGDTWDSEVMVYALKSNSWKKAGGFPYDFQSQPLLSRAQFADGALHWFAVAPGTTHGLIAAFDLAAEEFRAVPLAPEATPTQMGLVGVGMGVWEGRLCVIFTFPGKQTDIWVLMHDGVWARLLSTSHPQLTTPSSRVVPVAVFSNGNEVLLLKDHKEFLWYHLKSNKVKNAKIHGLPSSFIAVLCVQSLVNPLPMGKLKSDKGKKNAKKRDDFLSAGFKLVL